jgi:hypothetical protein
MATGKKTGGRQKGTPNKTTGALKDAILLAAEQIGEDAKGKDGLTGYLRMIAKSDVKAYAGLLGRVLPLQLTGDPENPVIVREVVRKIVDPSAQPGNSDSSRV